MAGASTRSGKRGELRAGEQRARYRKEADVDDWLVGTRTRDLPLRHERAVSVMSDLAEVVPASDQAVWTQAYHRLRPADAMGRLAEDKRPPLVCVPAKLSPQDDGAFVPGPHHRVRLSAAASAVRRMSKRRCRLVSSREGHCTDVIAMTASTVDNNMSLVVAFVHFVHRHGQCLGCHVGRPGVTTVSRFATPFTDRTAPPTSSVASAISRVASSTPR
jgi:hypothetical protein